MLELTPPIVAMLLGGLINLVWMATTLRIENRIGVKIEGLKAWLEDRYVSTPKFDGTQEVLRVTHADVERRLAKLELKP